MISWNKKPSLMKTKEVERLLRLSNSNPKRKQESWKKNFMILSKINENKKY